MSVKVAVVIPFATSETHDWENCDRTQAYYDENFSDWHVIIGADAVGVHSTNNFSRALAINYAADALHRNGPLPDVLVFNDADTLVPPNQLREAVTAAAGRDGIVQAFSEFVWLDRQGELEAVIPSSAQCVCALSVRTWERLTGYDPRFQGWGYEDLAFGIHNHAVFGVRRIEGRVYHHWHPRREGSAPELEAANLALWERYVAADGDVIALDKIRAEA